MKNNEPALKYCVTRLSDFDLVYFDFHSNFCS